MKKEQIQEFFRRFEATASNIEGVECWSTRDMQHLLGYSKWKNFENVINKAKQSCRNAAEEVNHHFPEVRKTIPKPNGVE